MNEVLEKYALHHRIGLFLGAVIFLVMLALPAPAPMSDSAWKTTALTALMAIWWMSEAAPIFVTALLPIVLLPVLDVATIKDATAPYANPIIFLFMGGFFIALAIEAHGLHRHGALASQQNLTATALRRWWIYVGCCPDFYVGQQFGNNLNDATDWAINH